MFLFYCSNSPMLKLVREQLHLQGPDFEIKSTDVITFIVWFDYHYIMNKWDNKNSKSYYDKQYKTNSNNNCAYRFLLLTSSRFWTKWFYSWHLHFFVFLLQVFFYQKMKGNLYWIKKKLNVRQSDARNFKFTLYKMWQMHDLHQNEIRPDISICEPRNIDLVISL